MPVTMMIMTALCLSIASSEPVTDGATRPLAKEQMAAVDNALAEQEPDWIPDTSRLERDAAVRSWVSRSRTDQNGRPLRIGVTVLATESIDAAKARMDEARRTISLQPIGSVEGLADDCVAWSGYANKEERLLYCRTGAIVTITVGPTMADSQRFAAVFATSLTNAKAAPH